MKKLYYFSFVFLISVQFVHAQSMQSKQEVKNHFKNGYAPGAIHFGYLIDACYNYSIGEGLLYDPANNVLKAEVPENLLKASLRDTAKVLRNERLIQIEKLKQSLSGNEIFFDKQLKQLESRMNGKLTDTAVLIRTSFNKQISKLNSDVQTDLNFFQNEMNRNASEMQSTLEDSVRILRLRIDSETSNLNGSISQLEKSVTNQFAQFDANKSKELADTASSIRFDMQNLNGLTNSKLNSEILKLDDKINENHSAFKDTSANIRSDFDLKLNKLEIALRDTSNVLRKSISDLNNALLLKIETGDKNIESLLEISKEKLVRKIDSLADVHNLDRKKHEDRMALIEKNHSVLNDTVAKMKLKLDTLNYTEENFTQTLKLKLDNVEDGATRSDNNFTDELKTKLDGIEQNANNYQLPLGTHSKLGGIKLSQDFVLYNGKAYNALDASKIDREYAKDTIIKNWTSEMKDDDEWTRIRYKIENGQIDAEGNKLYDYGEWNQPYKFIYDDLEASYYEFNATDSVNVILGIHEKDKKFTGEANTLIGHGAGYTLYKGGNRNVLIGKNSGRASENVSDNVFIGNQAGESIGDPLKTAAITGNYNSERNVAVGNKAMQGRNASGQSVALGYSALELGEQNAAIAIGYKAAANNSGKNNVLIGYEAGISVPGSNNNNNIAIGYRSGYKNTYAKRNVLIGDSTAFNNESGENNVFIGHGAGKSNTGNGNVIIGNDIDLAGSDQLAIGNNRTILISGDLNSKSVSIDKLLTNELSVTTSKSDSYLVADKEVINNKAVFVGEGGVNTSGQIISSYSNTKSGTNKAISAPNGSVSGKYLSANESILIGTSDVINKSETFVGTGGVNTTGSIRTNADINAQDVNSINADFTEKLSVAGIDVIKTTGSLIEERYAQQSHTHQPGDIKTNTSAMFVSQSEKNKWNNKVDKVSGKVLSSNDFSSAYKSKLDGIASGANKYVHPALHSASMITQDATHRFVSDSEKNTWNNKVDKVSGKQLTTNDFTTTEKNKLARIQVGANKYVHPASHSASMITQDANHRFISDSERNKWNNKVDKMTGKGLSANDFTNAEKSKLAILQAHPATHSADIITTTTSKQFVSQTEKDNWNAGQIPVGGIIMWSGTKIPDGWALCNGQTVHGKGTPDLRGRFIMGSSSRYSIGNTGGIEKVTLTTDEMPAHGHDVSESGSHKHNVSIDYGGSHTHSYQIHKAASKGKSRSDAHYRVDRNLTTKTTSSSGNHKHNASMTNAGKHSHTIYKSGGGEAHENRPPYYVLAFIMRVK
jgi:microcystin-dependent protein